MMTTRTWSLCSDLDGVGTAMITSRVMSVPSSAHPRRVANSSRSPRQADFADPLGGRLHDAFGSDHRIQRSQCVQSCDRLSKDNKVIYSQVEVASDTRPECTTCLAVAWRFHFHYCSTNRSICSRYWSGI